MEREFVVFISWVIGIIVAIVVMQLPILPFRWILKGIYQEFLDFWNWLLKIWNSFPSPIRFIIAIITFMVLAFSVMLLYKFHDWFDALFLSADVKELINEGELGQEDLSNIRRNIWLLGFALFGTCLAIWARLAHERKLQYTREQIERSERKNNNDRLTKAIELIENIDNRTSSREGLNILRNLADENPKTEYIRCVENICIWLLLHREKVSERGLLDKALEIFKIKNTDRLDVAKTIKDNRLGHWPNLQNANLKGANLQGVYLQKVDLQNVDLQEADLEDADLQGGDLESANLQSANLRNANMQGAFLVDTTLQLADLRGANLQEVNLDAADLQRVALDGANLQDANLRKVNLQNASLRSANLQYVMLWDTNLQNADFKNANLDGVDFEEANLKDANLTNAKMRDARYLTKKQILSAKWFEKSRENRNMKKKIRSFPPELPDELMDDPEVRKWLETPAPDEENNYMSLRHRRFLKETVTKKATAKKAVAKKIKAKAKAKKATAKKAKAKKPKN